MQTTLGGSERRRSLLSMPPTYLARRHSRAVPSEVAQQARLHQELLHTEDALPEGRLPKFHSTRFAARLSLERSRVVAQVADPFRRRWHVSSRRTAGRSPQRTRVGEELDQDDPSFDLIAPPTRLLTRRVISCWT
jgi:hypothetical protein